MRRTPISIILSFVVAIFVAFIFNPTDKANSLTVSGTVAPVRAITVNSQQIIVEIARNYSFEVTPTVYLVGNPSQPVAYSSNIREQYIELSKNIDFSKFGVVYRQPSPVMKSQETSFWGSIGKHINSIYLSFIKHISDFFTFVWRSLKIQTYTPNELSRIGWNGSPDFRVRY